MHLLKKLLTYYVCLSLFSLQAFADNQGRRFTTAEELLTNTPRANEYVTGNYPGAVLMPVNLWGAVGKSGIYHIPVQTDLLTLLSFAGGPSKDAQLEDVTIKRRNKGQEQIINLNLRDVMRSRDPKVPVLEPNDIVMLETKEETISNNTLKTVTVLSLVLGIVLSGIAINDRFAAR